MQELMKGKRYTITPGATYGDRSYTHGVHVVQAFNATHVQTTYHDERYTPRTLILLRQEHTFSPAEEFELPAGRLAFPGMDDAPLPEAPTESTDSLN